MKKILLIISLGIILLGAGWGMSPNGRPEHGAEKNGTGQYGSGGEADTGTYWVTAMTDRWTDTMITDSLWTTTMNTEIP